MTGALTHDVMNSRASRLHPSTPGELKQELTMNHMEGQKNGKRYGPSELGPISDYCMILRAFG